MRDVYLYGHLKNRFGAKFSLNAETPGQALRLLAANFPDFVVALREGSYRLIRGRRRGGMDLPLEAVEMRLGQADFHLVPVLVGAKSGGGAIKAVLGVALVGAAIFLSGGTLAAPLMGMGTAAFGVGGMAITYGNIAGFGLIAALAGVSQLIAPATKNDAAATQKEDSFAFSGPVNTSEQGYPNPLIYGEVITGGIPVSANFEIEDIPLGPLGTTVSTGSAI